MALMMIPRTATTAPSGYNGGGRSPIGIGGAIAVHALVAGVFLLMPREVIAPYVPTILVGNPIPLDPPPPPEPAPPSEERKLPARERPDPAPTATDPVTPPLTAGDTVLSGRAGTDETGGTGTDILLPPADPLQPPQIIDASIDPRALSAFQPDYPGSMVRLGLEGKVTVRVTIGADGRVTGIERLAATDEAFWTATQRHALRKWRFRPATRDGVPVGSSKVLTVHFRLTDL